MGNLFDVHLLSKLAADFIEVLDIKRSDVISKSVVFKTRSICIIAYKYIQ